MKVKPHNLEPAVLARVHERIEHLASFSEQPDGLTRTIFSPAMRDALDQVHEWMEGAGMTVGEDALGNIRGNYSASGDARALLIGSHLDTVPNGGKYDGALGVILGIACVEQLRASGARFPFPIEVAGFADEEGWKYGTAYLGSATFMGEFDEAWLDLADAEGWTMGQALGLWVPTLQQIRRSLKKRSDIWGFIEPHLEQGPCLESADRPLGVVVSVIGQSRAMLEFRGKAGHAGTTPMNLRHDALAAAAAFIVEVESVARGEADMVATVGRLEVTPSVINVIPGDVTLSLDLRHPEDEVRMAAVQRLHEHADQVSGDRGIELAWRDTLDWNAVRCSEKRRSGLSESVRKHQPDCPELVSGAGHDFVSVSRHVPGAMLFVRCRDGVSHHPDEYVSPEDIAVSLAALVDFVSRCADEGLHDKL